MVTVTPKAVEKIREAFQRENVQGGLRLGVLGGGCSGLSYQFKFDPKPRPTDKVLNFDDVQVYIDPKSLVFLDGMTLDWKDSLIQSGFVFENPHAKKSCGCGTSFSQPEAPGVDASITKRSAWSRSWRSIPTTCKKRFYERSRQWHPDRFSRASAGAAAASAGYDGAAQRRLPNLRDPVTRAEYFLKQNAASSYRKTFRRSCSKKFSN